MKYKTNALYFSIRSEVFDNKAIERTFSIYAPSGSLTIKSMSGKSFKKDSDETELSGNNLNFQLRDDVNDTFEVSGDLTNVTRFAINIRGVVFSKVYNLKNFKLLTNLESITVSPTNGLYLTDVLNTNIKQVDIPSIFYHTKDIKNYTSLVKVPAYNISGNFQDFPSSLTIFVINRSIMTDNLMDLNCKDNLRILSFEGCEVDLSRIGEFSNLVEITGSTAHVYGDLNAIKACSQLAYIRFLSKSSEVTGDLGNTPSICQYIEAVGLSSLNYKVRKTWNSTMRSVKCTLSDSSDIDNLLLDLSNVLTWEKEKVIEIKGGKRTSASDAAVEKLQRAGVKVTINML